jgi:S1-C subfamily serine protease
VAIRIRASLLATAVVSIVTANPLGRAPAFPLGLPQADPGAQTNALGLGSGFLVSADGYIAG